MSMPQFIAGELANPGREESVNQIIATIALEEISLSHILNAEGEKIQFALGTLGDTGRAFDDVLTIAKLVDLDNSVAAVLQGAAVSMAALTDKLRVALNANMDV